MRPPRNLLRHLTKRHPRTVTPRTVTESEADEAVQACRIIVENLSTATYRRLLRDETGFVKIDRADALRLIAAVGASYVPEIDA